MIIETETVAEPGAIQLDAAEPISEPGAQALSAPSTDPGAEANTDPGIDLSNKYPIDQPVTKLDATDLRSLFQAAHDWLAHNYEYVNKLNVFPVPDGDTGTNMLLTIKSAWHSILHQEEQTVGDQTVGDVAAAAAEGAHQGSRGNSGVILGQILRGFAQALREKAEITTHDLAEALRRGSDAAYQAVPSPVEGTILTVARDSSSAAEDAAEKTHDLRAMLADIVRHADESVNRTPDMLPVLKKAGVVDSGGKGFFYLLEGMYRSLSGQSVEHNAASSFDAAEAAREEALARKGHRLLPSIHWGFDVQYLIEQPKKSVAVIAAEIAAMGDCPLVEGDEKLVKVHVHVFDPGVPLSYGVATGFITDVVVENMDDMAAAGPLSEAQVQAAAELDDEQIGLVAVVPGEGFAEIFRSLGANAVVEGGQSMNPSVAELADAVRSIPIRRIVLLPNNSNILMAAQQTAKLVAKDADPRQVIVVPARSMPQGVAALTAFDSGAVDMTTLLAAMTQTMGAAQTGELTQAVRTAEVDGIHVHQGDLIGLHNDKLVSCGHSLQEVALDLLVKMGAATADLITIYYGDFVAAAAAQDFAETVRSEYPSSDVELAYGGQPHYHYVLSAE